MVNCKVYIADKTIVLNKDSILTKGFRESYLKDGYKILVEEEQS